MMHKNRVKLYSRKGRTTGGVAIGGFLEELEVELDLEG